MNNDIHKSWCSLSYVTMGDGAQGLASFGKGALMAKVDIRSTYRVIPVHPKDQWLMGMRWQKKFYVNTTLPFGLRSAPNSFS